MSSDSKRHKYYSSTPKQNDIVVSGDQEPIKASSLVSPSPSCTMHFVESSFVTPGLFKRKMRNPKRNEKVDADSSEESETSPGNEKFNWSIDQMAILWPKQFDESEMSLPPEDWDPSAEISRTHPSMIEQFWLKNTHIAPSPEVIAAVRQRSVLASSSSLANNCSSVQLPDLNTAQEVISAVRHCHRNEMASSSPLANNFTTVPTTTPHRK